MYDSSKINRQLQQIADFLINKADFLGNVGLFNGKTGVALFLFHLGRETGNKAYEEFAGELTDRICESLSNPDLPFSYANGLAGIGTGIDYMIKQKFIDADSDVFLEDFDSIIYQLIQNFLPSMSEINMEIMGFGRYLVERYSKTNHEILFAFINALSCPYITYDDIMSAIHFLSSVVPLNVAQEKAKAYLNYAVNKLETMVHEDVHFGNFPNGGFHPLIAAVTLVMASEKAGNGIYAEKANQYLQLYELPFRDYLSNKNQTDALKWSYLYRYLYNKLGDPVFLEQSEDRLNIALTKDYQRPASVGLLDGYAGAGMYLLSLIGHLDGKWLDIIPCYISKSNSNVIR